MVQGTLRHHIWYSGALDPGYALVLIVSTLAAALAGFSYLRSVPARVEHHAETAHALAEQLRLEFETWKAEAGNILGAVQEERERTQKAAARRSAGAQRERQLEGLHQPQTRDEVLVGLRERAGMT